MNAPAKPAVGGHDRSAGASGRCPVPTSRLRRRRACRRRSDRERGQHPFHALRRTASPPRPASALGATSRTATIFIAEVIFCVDLTLAMRHPECLQARHRRQLRQAKRFHEPVEERDELGLRLLLDLAVVADRISTIPGSRDLISPSIRVLEVADPADLACCRDTRACRRR